MSETKDFRLNPITPGAIVTAPHSDIRWFVLRVKDDWAEIRPHDWNLHGFRLDFSDLACSRVALDQLKLVRSGQL